jgi:hypothetical protein
MTLAIPLPNTEFRVYNAAIMKALSVVVQVCGWLWVVVGIFLGVLFAAWTVGEDAHGLVFFAVWLVYLLGPGAVSMYLPWHIDDVIRVRNMNRLRSMDLSLNWSYSAVPTQTSPPPVYTDPVYTPPPPDTRLSSLLKLRDSCLALFSKQPIRTLPDVKIFPDDHFAADVIAHYDPNEVWICFNQSFLDQNPSYDRLADTMTHELLHCWIHENYIDMDGDPHGPPFEACAKMLGIPFNPSWRKEKDVEDWH